MALTAGVVFNADSLAYDQEGKVLVYDPMNSYVPVELRRPESERNTGDYLGRDLSPSGTQQALAGSSVGGFQVQKVSGNWQLAPIALPPSSVAGNQNRWRGGNGGAFVLRGSDQWQVFKNADQSLLGTIPGEVNSYGDTIMSNGTAVLKGTQIDDKVDTIYIYYPDLQPPGC